MVSIEGTVQSVDDDEDGSNDATELTYITAAIDWGSSQIDCYLVKRYTLSDLSSSTFLKFINAVFAARNLAIRRWQNVPTAIAQMYDESVELLQDIARGYKDIPDVIESFNHMPTVTNYWTQFWSSVTPVRTQDCENTGDGDWQGELHRPTATQRGIAGY